MDGPVNSTIQIEDNLSSKKRPIFLPPWSILILIIIPLTLLFSGLDSFPYPTPDAAYSDITITHYPNAVYLKRAISEYQVLPLWSPTILSGYPFFANPLSGLWYPPGWVALLFSLPLGFNLLVAIHILGGGLGMYVLLRSEGLSEIAALWGGLAFEAMPKLFAHYGAGHLTLLYAVPWTPWLLYTWREKIHYTRCFGKRIKLRKWSSVILGMIFLADVRWAVYAGILWVGYAVGYWKTRMQDNKNPSSAHSPMSRFDNLGEESLSFLIVIIIAALLASPLSVPFIEYVSLSTRTGLRPEEAFTLSLPFARILGLLFPDFSGFHEWVLYAGGGVLLLALVAVLDLKKVLGKKNWLWIFILSLIFSLGSNIPFLSLVGKIPGLNLLRVPSRMLFITGMSLAVLSAYTMDQLTSSPNKISKSRLSYLLVGLNSFIIILSFGIIMIVGELQVNLLWGMVIILTLSVLLILRIQGKISLNIFLIILVVVTLIDWGIVNGTLISFKSADSVMAEQGDIAAYIAEKNENFRTYSPSYSIPQHTAADHGLELADGVDPMQLKSYSDFMVEATGVPRIEYSVTLPPFHNGNPSQDNVGFIPDPKLLDYLNVRYVISEFDLNIPELILRQVFATTRIYENSAAFPRAWVENTDGLTDEEFTAVQEINWTPNRVTIKATGPGILTLSEIWYPGWKVLVDGESASIEKVIGVLRGVEIEPGEHHVEFVFRPISLYAGLLLCFLGLTIWFGSNANKSTAS